MENPTLEQIFAQNLQPKVPNFYVFTTHVIGIRPVVSGAKDLLTFHVYKDYRCTMTYTSFAQSCLISTEFKATTSINEVIKWVKEIFNQIEAVIASTKTPN